MSSADGGPVVNAMAERLQPVLVLVGVIWALEIVNLLTGHVLVSWGILPRSLSGLIGIPLAPLIHGGLWHTLSNTVPLALLGTLTLASGPQAVLADHDRNRLALRRFGMAVCARSLPRWRQQPGVRLFPARFWRAPSPNAVCRRWRSPSLHW